MCFHKLFPQIMSNPSFQPSHVVEHSSLQAFSDGIVSLPFPPIKCPYTKESARMPTANSRETYKKYWLPDLRMAKSSALVAQNAAGI
jgi:hypothetical protein